MKKLIFFLFIVPLMLLYPLTADAMKMSEPIVLGSISTDQIEASDEIHGYSIEGETANKGKRVLRLGEKLYKKGCATFGKDDLTIYAHYDLKGSDNYIGGKNKENAIETGWSNESIQAIRTDSGIVFYIVHHVYFDSSGFTILGKLPDGRFIKYVDSDNLRETYFSKEELARNPRYYRIHVKNNMIIANYVADSDPWGRNAAPISGELRFPWDEKAQWFGVEKR